MSELIAVFTTVATPDDARELARVIVERRLAACAQVSQIESFYRWKGALQQDPECRVLFKTTADRYAELEAAIRELHRYELPAIYALPVSQAFEPYADWVRAEASHGAPR